MAVETHDGLEQGVSLERRSGVERRQSSALEPGEVLIDERRGDRRSGEDRRKIEDAASSEAAAARFRELRRGRERRQREERRRNSAVMWLEGKLAGIRWQFPWWQGVVLIGFCAMVFGPLFLPPPPENAGPLDNLTVFANYVMWGLWFPLVLLSVVITGRSWCGLFCPQGAASEWASHVGLQRPVPRWLRWEGTPIVSFLLVTVLGQTIGVRDHPEAIGELFGGTLLGAILIGLVFGSRKRVWCRHMCPIGLLLGIFSRLGMVHFAYSHKLKGGDRYTEKGLCPTMVDIRYKEESRHCIVCFRCINPNHRNSVMMDLRPPGREVAQIDHFNPNIYETFFLFLGTGIALGGFLWLVLPWYMEFRLGVGEWFFGKEWYWAGEYGPWWLMSVHPEQGEAFSWIDFFSIISFMVGFMALLTLTLTATTWLCSWLALKSGGQRTLRQGFVELGYQYAPVAMISLVLGLGAELFSVFEWVGLDRNGIGVIKFALFSLAFLWSVFLGYQILGRQGVVAQRRWLPMVPGVLGSVVIGLAWSQALF